MAVAAQLARIRSASGARAAPPTVIFENARDAAKQPRVEVAGNALNALEALKACDTVLRELSGPLLLRDLADRSIIDPEREENVSHAVTVTALRLAPVFPTRAAQRIIEWIVRGLDAGRLGSDAEIDALLIAALPFHTTPHFVRLTQALLARKHRGANTRSSWLWLDPVVKENQPPSLSFIVSNASDSCLQAAIGQMASSAVAGVPVTHIAGFISSILSARLLAARTNPLKRRTLSLFCLEALSFNYKKFTTLTGKREKETKHSAAAVREMNRAKVALLVPLATAVAGNVLEKEIIETVLFAAITTLTAKPPNREIAECAAACVLICVARSKYEPIPFEMSRLLIKWGRFANALRSLHGTPGIREVYASYLSSLALKAPENKMAMESLAKELSFPRKALLSNSTVGTIIFHLLEAFAKEVDDSDERIELKRILTKLLQPVARGAFASGVDLALRKHFNERRAKKKARARYIIIDDALVEAMAGTPYIAVKIDAEATTLSEHTLLNCLEHPEPNVRTAGIKRLAEEKSLINDTKNDSSFGKRLRSVLMRRIRDDVDIKVATVTLESKLVEQFCPAMDAVTAIGRRVRQVFSSISVKKRSKLSTRVREFTREALACCMRIADGNAELVMRYESLLIGLQIEGVLSNSTVCDMLGEKLAPRLSDLFRVSGENHNASALDKLKQTRWDVKTCDLVEAVFQWDQNWGLDCVAQVFDESDCGASEKSNAVLQTINFFVNKCVENASGNASKREEALLGCVKSMNFIDNQEICDMKNVLLLWDSLTKYAEKNVITEFVTLSCEKLNPEKVFSFLLKAAGRAKNQRAMDIALTWASALVKAGLIKSDGDLLVRILLSAIYGGKDSTAALRVCKQLDVCNVADCSTEIAVDVFKRLKKVVSKLNGAFVPEMKHIRQSNVSEQLLKTLPTNEHTYTIASLSDVKNGQLVFTMFATVDQNDCNQFLACLRTLEGAVADTPDSLNNVLQALSTTLSKGEHGDEKFARLVALLPDTVLDLSVEERAELPGTVKALVCTDELLAACKYLVEFAESDSNVNEGVAAGLCKCVGLIRNMCQKKDIGSLVDDSVDILFSLATRSNSVGSFASRLLNDVPGIEFDYVRITSRLNENQAQSNGPAKRRRTPARKCTQKGIQEEKESLVSDEIRRSAVTGSLEALTRLDDIPEDVRTNLWTFARACGEMVKDERSESVLADSEYNLSLVLRTLTKRADDLLEPDDAAAAVNLCFYEGSEGSMLNEAAAELVRSLSKKNSAPLCAHIGPFVTLLLTKESTANSIECLSAIVPALIADGGLSVEKLMRIALDANPGAASSVRPSVLDCVRICEDSSSAAASAVDIVLEEGEGDAPIALATKLVLAGGDDVSRIVGILCGRKDIRLARLTLSVLESLEFMHALDKTLSAAVTDGVPKLEDLDNAFAQLYSMLLKCEDTETRPKALAVLFSVVPGSIVSQCLREALNGKDGKRKVRALDSVVQFLGWNSRITDSWLGNEDEQEEPMQFLASLCESMRGCVTVDGLKDNTKCEIVALAIRGIESVARRWRPETQELLIEIRNCGSVLASLLGNISKLKAESDILAAALTSLAAVISAVGETSFVFVPLLSSAVAVVVEETPKTRAKHPPLDAAISAGNEVLLCAPRMFGKKALQRVATVAAVAEREQITGFLHTAVGKVPMASSVEALSHALEAWKNDGSACRVIMHSVVKMVNAARKRDVREHRSNIFGICLKVLDFRRRTCRDEEGQVVDEGTTGCGKVEEAAFGAVGELMLRLAEAPVNELFATAAAWSDEEVLDEEEVERLGVDCPPTILRLYPLFGLYRSLFGTLGRFAVKPFGAVLKHALILVKSRQTKLSSRLGKRTKPDGVICMETVRGEAARAALGAVEKFLRAIPDATAVSEEALESVRDAVAIALDGGADVQSCVAALADRMCVADETRTKEQCRGMLTGLSRTILLRAREAEPATRLKALQCVDAVLETVGDEYLVALPEAMPVLADTVDDEVEEVAGAAKEFVRRLEAYTGQPIMEELKG